MQEFQSDKKCLSMKQDTLRRRWTLISCCVLGDVNSPLWHCCHSFPVRETNLRAAFESFAISSFLASHSHPLLCHVGLIAFFPPPNQHPGETQPGLKCSLFICQWLSPPAIEKEWDKINQLPKKSSIFSSFDLTWPLTQWVFNLISDKCCFCVINSIFFQVVQTRSRPRASFGI